MVRLDFNCTDFKDLCQGCIVAGLSGGFIFNTIGPLLLLPGRGVQLKISNFVFDLTNLASVSPMVAGATLVAGGVPVVGGASSLRSCQGMRAVVSNTTEVGVLIVRGLIVGEVPSSREVALSGG